MLEGTIRRLDLDRRTAVIVTEGGEEVMVRFPPGVNIEVSELETVGTVGGDLEDLDIGYLVEIEVRNHNEDGSCDCASLVSIS